MPPSPPRPPAPPTTGWMDRPGDSHARRPVWSARFIVEYLRQSLGELSNVAWPSSGALRANATLLLLTLVVVIVGLGVVELAAGTLARGLFA
jgi:preprotein translocase subunit SecE